jgi:hypothetical protein
MNPYAEPQVRRCLRAFLERFYRDGDERLLVLGINPGRFGAGVTGVTFTDPVALNDYCGIPTHLPRRRELSSVFVYEFIDQLGGPAAFYERAFLSAVSPLGFTSGGTNLNYYDTPQLARAVTPFIISTLRQQIALGTRRDAAVVLGLGDNRRYLERLNQEHGFFERIVPLEHPRWILQYRRRRMAEYVAKYVATFRELTG